MKKFLAIALLACVVSAGCATTPQSPAQSVYALKSAYAGGLTIAVAYKKLPVCGQSAAKLCSSPSVVAQLQDADNKAAPAINAAEKSVRTPGFGFNVQTLINVANEALVAFLAITAKLQVK